MGYGVDGAAYIGIDFSKALMRPEWVGWNGRPDNDFLSILCNTDECDRNYYANLPGSLKYVECVWPA